MDTKDPLPLALAALEVCEALILTLVERRILAKDDAIRLLENVVSAKSQTASEDRSESHAKAAVIVTELLCSLEAVDRE